MDYASAVRSKYSYLSNDEADLYVNRAKSILVEQLYPADESVSYETYIVPPRYDMWILDCVDELIERAGISSVTAYRENGVSYNWGKSGISDGLLQRIQRNAGTVK